MFQDVTNIPKTTTKKCISCSEYSYTHHLTHQLTKERVQQHIKHVQQGVQHMCAVSNKDPSKYDVCGGDLGGSNIHLPILAYIFILLIFRWTRTGTAFYLFKGPLTISGTNIIVGIVEAGESCYDRIRNRVSAYIDVRRNDVQNFIKQIVPDLEIEEGT